MRAHVHIQTRHGARARARLGVLSVCSYAKRARDLRLFCQPSRLSLVLRSLLCFTLLVLAVSFSLSLSSSPLCQFPSLVRVSFPVRLAPSRSYISLYVRVSLFFSSSFIYVARGGFGIILQMNFVICLPYSLLRRKIARNVCELFKMPE